MRVHIAKIYYSSFNLLSNAQVLKGLMNKSVSDKVIGYRSYCILTLI